MGFIWISSTTNSLLKLLILYNLNLDIVNKRAIGCWDLLNISAN